MSERAREKKREKKLGRKKENDGREFGGKGAVAGGGRARYYRVARPARTAAAAGATAPARHGRDRAPSVRAS